MVSRRYAGRLIALATQHGKQQVLARPLRHGLGLTLRHAASVNTDRFGSFAGDQVRSADAPTTCRLKAEAALEALDLDLGIASEGSFGPHPAVPFLAIGQEWLTLVDRRDGFVISQPMLCSHTNFGSCAAADPEACASWLRQVAFPSHALMVRPHAGDHADPLPWLAKGIHRAAELAQWMAVAVDQSPLGLAWLETDMRAHCNPTRMASIRRLAFRLVRRVGATCPACEAPGWGLVSTRAGLPCRACGLATELVQLEEFGCVACSHRTLLPRRDGLMAADPAHCPYCNP
jgi:hypothetical protein